jgi:hypothetical protein
VGKDKNDARLYDSTCTPTERIPIKNVLDHRRRKKKEKSNLGSNDSGSGVCGGWIPRTKRGTLKTVLIWPRSLRTNPEG